MGTGKRNRSLNFLSFGLLFVLILSCGVKDRRVLDNQQGVVTGAFPEAIFWTKQKKLLTLAAKNQFSVGNVTIAYKTFTEDLELVSGLGYSTSVKYRMPEMPEMPVTPAIIEQSPNGEAKVTYEISMGGL